MRYHLLSDLFETFSQIPLGDIIDFPIEISLGDLLPGGSSHLQ